jgi:aminoglycoside 3-N-acetyltransferase
MTNERAPRLGGSGPLGQDQLAAHLRSLGPRRGQDLLIHCSIRRIGLIDGGAATLLAAIREVAGPRATFVVPTQTAWNSLFSPAFRAATVGLDTEGRARFVAAMPGFDPASTPSAGMGAFAEYLRTRPSACRSAHPQSSFAAIGPRAHACTRVHDLDCHLGDRSPLGWLYSADAAILLLGVGYSVCTAFHLAEYRLLGEPPRRSYHCFVSEGGKRAEREFTDIDLDDSDFASLGADLEATAETDPSPGLRRGIVGAAECRLVSMRLAVDFACSWLMAHRQGTVHDETV